MSVSGVNNSANTYSTQTNATNNTSQNATDKTNQNSKLNLPEDQVSIGTQTASTKKSTYGKPANPELVAKLKKEAETGQNQLKNLVEKLLLKQGQTLNSNGFINIDQETRQTAQEMISAGGFYSVEKTSERILEFAKGLIGDDISKLPMIRDAIEKGFKLAEGTWNRNTSSKKLPDISYQTYDRIMEELDSWEKAGAIPAPK